MRRQTEPLWLADFEVGQAIAPAAWLVGMLLVGFLVYRVIARRLRGVQTLTSWGGDDILIGAAHYVVPIWFGLGGAFGAVRSVPLRDDVAGMIERALVVILILSGTWIVARVIADFMKLYMMRSTGIRSSSTLLITLARIAVFLVGVLVMLQALGVPIGPLLGALGIGGLAVALALQDTLASIFAGIQLLASRKIQPGDFIELVDGHSGEVIDIDWRNTTIRMLPNNDVIIPNSELAKQVIINYHRPVQEMSLVVQVGVAYDSDLEHVERVTIEVALDVQRTVEGAVATHEPFIRYHTFDDSSIDFSVILRLHNVRTQHLLRHEFMKRLKSRYDREGIQIPFPIRTLHFDDESAVGEMLGARSRGAPRR